MVIIILVPKVAAVGCILYFKERNVVESTEDEISEHLKQNADSHLFSIFPVEKMKTFCIEKWSDFGEWVEKRVVFLVICERAAIC